MKNCQINKETAKRQNCLRVKQNQKKRHKMIKEKDKNSRNETNETNNPKQPKT